MVEYNVRLALVLENQKLIFFLVGIGCWKFLMEEKTQ